MKPVIRKATPDDLALLVRLRMAYLSTEHGEIPDREALSRQLTRYFETHLPDQTCVAILAEAGGQTVSAAFLAISDVPASPSFLSGKIGTLLNVMICPNCRRQGIATEVLSRLVEEARLLGVSSLRLSATPDGKPLYEKMGFLPSEYTYMTLNL